jgi:hypothetical protein
MVDVVWAICADGPLEATVFEISCDCRTVNITDNGVHVYRRSGWSATEKGHRIALFAYVKTLVV